MFNIMNLLRSVEKSHIENNRHGTRRYKQPKRHHKLMYVVLVEIAVVAKNNHRPDNKVLDVGCKLVEGYQI